jgi:hypothetical protein
LRKATKGVPNSGSPPSSPHNTTGGVLCGARGRQHYVRYRDRERGTSSGVRGSNGRRELSSRLAKRCRFMRDGRAANRQQEETGSRKKSERRPLAKRDAAGCGRGGL